MPLMGVNGLFMSELIQQTAVTANIPTAGITAERKDVMKNQPHIFIFYNNGTLILLSALTDTFFIV